MKSILATALLAITTTTSAITTTIPTIGSYTYADHTNACDPTGVRYLGAPWVCFKQGGPWIGSLTIDYASNADGLQPAIWTFSSPLISLADQPGTATFENGVMTEFAGEHEGWTQFLGIANGNRIDYYEWSRPFPDVDHVRVLEAGGNAYVFFDRGVPGLPGIPSPIPEPESYALMLAGLAGLAAWRRYRTRRQM